ncbi:hypothetical protein SAMN05444274_11453 [Mariniphaga anaerophila]|uniref:Uncharacterized protein n=1 Tax=Mariniphaga anaerophila TaxID=1484053 RepID=A0A1M5FT93_9BACT|nr:hypothetical protein [Mariniphaga anaerophila]SHF94614.1 hypothetical protein SAMN05444274_11453 [Mariniphaga anaerophila]
MSNLEDYNARLSDIQAIPDEETREPGIPVDVFLQEAENLHYWSLDDAAALAVVGITTDTINDLPVRAGACREAQSIWNKDYRSQQEAQKQWAEQAPEAYAFRDDLLASLRFAYRKDDALLSRVNAISEGSSHADMIQDLNDISVLGREYPAPLTAIGFDLAQLDLAATRADELADLLAEANGDKSDPNYSKTIRDKAYTHLKALVDEIREAGKYVFRKDKNRLKGYSSEYWRKQNRKTSNDNSEATE